jgi:hypothetical protein
MNNTLKENWLPIKGYEGSYEVSDLGRVRNTRTGRILKQDNSVRGYHRVSLCVNGKQKCFRVHRLVLMTFAPCDDMDKLQVNHINENKDDNRLINLNWMTNKENCNWGTRNERLKEHPTCKAVAQYDKENNYIATYRSSKEAERQTGINQSNICKVAKNVKHFKTAGGYIWRYVEDER